MTDLLASLVEIEDTQCAYMKMAGYRIPPSISTSDADPLASPPHGHLTWATLVSKDGTGIDRLRQTIQGMLHKYAMDLPRSTPCLYRTFDKAGDIVYFCYVPKDSPDAKG